MQHTITDYDDSLAATFQWVGQGLRATLSPRGIIELGALLGLIASTSFLILVISALIGAC